MMLFGIDTLGAEHVLLDQSGHGARPIRPRECHPVRDVTDGRVGQRKLASEVLGYLRR